MAIESGGFDKLFDFLVGLGTDRITSENPIKSNLLSPLAPKRKDPAERYQEGIQENKFASPVQDPYLRPPSGTFQQPAPGITEDDSLMGKVGDFAQGLKEQVLPKQAAAGIEVPEYSQEGLRFKAPNQKIGAPEDVGGYPLKQKMVEKAQAKGVDAKYIDSILAIESGYNPQAANDKIPENERSYGLGQINLNAHPQISKEQAMDPEFALNFVVDRYAHFLEATGDPLLAAVQYNVPGNVVEGKIQPYGYPYAKYFAGGTGLPLPDYIK